MKMVCWKCEAHSFDYVDKKAHRWAHWCKVLGRALAVNEAVCPPGAPKDCPRGVDVEETLNELAALPTPRLDQINGRRKA